MKPVARLTSDQRRQVKEEMRAAMIAAARARQTMTYTDLALQVQTAYVHPHSFLMARLLNEIGSEEVAAGRGVLPAVVVRRSSGIPGGGYFRVSAQATPPADGDLEQRWRDDLNALFDFWATHDP